MKKRIFALTTILTLAISITAFADNRNGVDDKKIFRGKVIEKTDKNFKTTIKVINEFEQIADFNINSNTYKIMSDQVEKGEDILVVYTDKDTTRSIYSNNFDAYVVTDDMTESNASLEVLNEELESVNNPIRFDTDSQTAVISGRNNLYSGEIDENNALVFYEDVISGGKSNEVLAKKIILLDDKNMPDLKDRSFMNEKENIDNLNEKELDRVIMTKNMSEIFVEFEPIVNAKYYQMTTGAFMLPLETIAKKLGFEVKYNEESGMFSVNEEYFMLLGNTTCNFKGDIYIMDAAPVIIDKEIYISTEFFSSAMNMYAYVVDGKALIYK